VRRAEDCAGTYTRISERSTGADVYRCFGEVAVPGRDLFYLPLTNLQSSGCTILCLSSVLSFDIGMISLCIDG